MQSKLLARLLKSDAINDSSIIRKLISKDDRILLSHHEHKKKQNMAGVQYNRIRMSTLITAGVGKSICSMASPMYEHMREKAARS